MKLKSTQRKSLATVPSDYQGQERRFAQSVSESLDILTGRRGDIIDRAVTFRDLLDTGVLKLVKGLGTGSTSGGVSVTNPTTGPDGLPIQLPTQPENFVVSGGFGVIFLSWTLPPYNGHDYVEIYRLQRTTGAAEPTLAQAEAAGVYTRYYGDLYQFTDTNVGSQENWYYWIRAVNKNGIAGPYYSSTGVNATTALDYLYISGLIDDILDDDVNNLGLNTTIDALDLNITQLENFTGYSSTYNGDTLLTRIGNVETVAGNAATSAQLQSEQTARATADSALAADITTLNSTVYDQTTGVAATYSGLQTEISTRSTADSALATRATALEATVNDGTTGVAATYAGLQSEQTARVNADSAIASDVNTLSVTVGNNTSSIQTVSLAVSGTNGVESKYAVKVDTNGHVSGFGLISTANDSGTVTSAFIVAADRFAIASPYNSSSSANSNVGTNYPFKVFTTTTTVNGVAIPAGVYIDDAFIHEAQIENAMVKDATITSAKIFDLSATRISAGNINIDNSNNIAIFQGKRTFSYYDTDLQKNVYVPNFNSTTSGFVLGNNNGNPVFHVGNATRFMKFDGATGDLTTTGLEVRDADGTVLLDSGGLRSSEGSNLLFNGSFVHGSNGWTSQGSVFFNTTQGRAYTDSGEYIVSHTLMPISINEPLYVYADVYGASAYATIVFYKADDSYTSTTVSGTLWSPSAANSHEFRVAKVDYPSYSGDPYTLAIIRFGTLTGGNTTTWHQVGVSKTPPVIDPSYASTYIRDLSVDTLQIAGNAVTVPLGASNENISSTYYLAISGTQTSEGTSWAKVCDLSALSWTSSSTAPEAITLIGSMNYSAATSGSSHESVRLKLIVRAGATVPTTYVSSGFSATSNVTELQSCGVSKQRNHSGTLAINFTLDVSQFNLQPNTNYYFALVGQTNAGSRRMFSNGLSAVASKK